MASFDFATVGDAVIRLDSPQGRRLEEADSFGVRVSGTEANVACALSRLGRKARWCGCLPATALGRRALLPLRVGGVDTETVVWRGKGRVSVYFVEQSGRPGGGYVIYDRDHSCFAKMQAGDVDWDQLLDARAFHATGITAAISASCAELVATGLRLARKRGLLTSLDVNYRSLMTSPDAARERLVPLLGDCDLLLCRRGDAREVFGIDGEAERALAGLAKLCGCRWVVMSDGGRPLHGCEDGACFTVTPPEVEIVDRVGAGDGLAAGVIHGLLNSDFAAGLRTGTALAAFILSQLGEQPPFAPGELELDALRPPQLLRR